MNYSIYILIFSLTWSFNSATSELDPNCDQYSLRQEILNRRKGNTLTRPVQAINDTIDLRVYFFIYHILNLDEKAETLSVDGWLMQGWLDYNLKWNDDDFKGCYSATLMKTDVWTPTIFLLNGADPGNIMPVPFIDAEIYVYSDGSVRWYQMNDFTVVCPFDFFAYPFDEQICEIIFISWSDNGNEVNISLATEENIVHYYMLDDHSEWEAVSSSSNISVWYYGEDFFYQEVNFYVRLKRRSLQYHLAIITPNAISILVMLIAFLIPHQCKNRLLVPGINLIILTILLIHLQWVVPRNGSKAPAIVIFCGNSIFFAGLSFLIIIATTCMYKDPPVSYPPTWIKNLLTGWLGVLLRIDFQKIDVQSNLAKEKSPHANTWKLIAIAVDRFCFVLYCIILSCILMFTFI